MSVSLAVFFVALAVFGVCGAVWVLAIVAVELRGLARRWRGDR